MHKAEKAITSANMASFLVLSGCKLNHTKRCLKNPKRYIYFFEDNRRLNFVIKSYSKYRNSLYAIQKSVLEDYSKIKDKGEQSKDERI